MELFTIDNLSFTYPEQEQAVLRNISLKLNQGDFAVLAGSSGCGKSTLLRQMKTVLFHNAYGDNNRFGFQVIHVLYGHVFHYASAYWE